jgi:hypothetical protein
MGAKELRDAFSGAAPGFSCTAALLDYERHENAEWQRLTFHGNDPNGILFEVKSDLLPPNVHLETVARSVAKKLAGIP